MIGLDTSILVRYFTQDDAEQGRKATKLLHSTLSIEQPGFVSLVTLAELAWVLRSRYRSTRNEVITIVEALLTAPNMVVQDANAVWMALDDCSAPGVGVADALIAAIGRLHQCEYTLTFDEKALRITGSKLLR